MRNELHEKLLRAVRLMRRFWQHYADELAKP